MDDRAVRTVLLEALESASVFTLRDRNLTDEFIAGRDVPLTELDIDSLAGMELCISIEINTGVSIAPEELSDLGSLNQIAARIREDYR